MRWTMLAGVIAIVAGMHAGARGAPAGDAAHAAGVHWIKVGAASDVEAAFAEARRSGRPVFLYWGAVWCPPCNQVKSTIFTRPDFIAQSRRFVPVYLDGDVPSAQRLGRRFRVSAYPTMVLMRPDGSEVTRLAGAVAPARYLQLLAYGLSAGRSAKQLLAAALRGEQLTPEDWRLLAFYSWETDDERLAPQHQAALLARLTGRCPPADREAAARLALQAIAAAARDKAAGGAGAITPAEALRRARAFVAAPELVRAHYDLATDSAPDIIAYASAPGSAARAQLTAAWIAALERLAGDASLPRAVPLWIMTAKIALLRLEDPRAPLPPALLAELRARVARSDHETTDPNERQSVIDAASEALSRAGLLDESDALLRAELARSHSPYYHMLGLAANARQRGDAAGAIAWARRAFEAARGHATRLQWGGRYVAYLVDLAPEASARIESAARQVLAEAAASPDAFFARNRRVLERLHRKLAEWNRDGRHGRVLERLRARMHATCGRLPAADADRTACDRLFSQAGA
jgi:thioredoxin-like negative regulator of GroEL